MANKSDTPVVDLTSSPPQHKSQPRSSNHINLAEDDEEEDEDLELALAMSLQDRREPQGQNVPFTKHDDDDNVPAQHEMEHDSEDEELKNAIALSLQHPQHTPSFNAGVESNAAPSTATTLLSLDRKAMEAERLARLKRKRDDLDTPTPFNAHTRTVSPPPLRRTVQSTTSANAPAPARVETKAASMSTPATLPSANATPSTSSTPQPPQLYPNGKVFKTHADGYPSTNTMSFPDLIAPASTLRFAVLSSYIWDFDWLLPHFATSTTQFNFIMHAKYPSERRSLEADFAGIPNVRLTFPNMDGIVNCMHSKLMLLLYEGDEQNGSGWSGGRCRVVIPTANLMAFDWGVGGVMENMLWVCDLPKLTKGDEVEAESFKSGLVRFLKAQGVEEKVLRRLDGYNFGGTRDVGFVGSAGGMHGAEAWRENGHCALGAEIERMGLGSRDEEVEVDFVTSSVGSLNDEFMRCMYLAAKGDDGLTELTLRTAKKFPAKRLLGENKLVQKESGQGWREHMRLYFPSHETVVDSNGGPDSAGTVCFQKRWWEGTKFPRANMRDCVSTRDGLLMHNKVCVSQR